MADPTPGARTLEEAPQTDFAVQLLDEARQARTLREQLAKVEAERDEAREDHVRAEAHICNLEVLAYIDPEHTYKDAAIKERVARVAAEARAKAAEAETARMRKIAEGLLLSFQDTARAALSQIQTEGGEA